MFDQAASKAQSGFSPIRSIESFDCALVPFQSDLCYLNKNFHRTSHQTNCKRQLIFNWYFDMLRTFSFIIECKVNKLVTSLFITLAFTNRKIMSLAAAVVLEQVKLRIVCVFFKPYVGVNTKVVNTKCTQGVLMLLLFLLFFSSLTIWSTLT